MSDTADNDPVEEDSGWNIEWGKLFVGYLLGRQGAGKSNMIKNIVRQSVESKTHAWYCAMTPTRHAGEFDYLDPASVVEFSPEKFLSIFTQIKAYREKCAKDKKKCKLSRGLLILSDTCGANQRLMFRPDFINAFICLRHYGPIDLIVDSQVYTGCPPVFRSLCTHICMWRTQGSSQTKKLHTFAGGMVDGGHKEFRRVLNEATSEDYSVLVYTANRPSFEKSYMSFVPKLADDFRVTYKLPFKIS